MRQKLLFRQAYGCFVKGGRSNSVKSKDVNVRERVSVCRIKRVNIDDGACCFWRINAGAHGKMPLAIDLPPSDCAITARLGPGTICRWNSEGVTQRLWIN